VKEVAPSVQIVGVEAEGANFLQRSLQAGERIIMPNANRFTDDVGIRAVGEENFRLCKDFVDKVITVSTDEICAAIKGVFGDTRALMEPVGKNNRNIFFHAGFLFSFVCCCCCFLM
jgi:threonine dehydratase